MQGRVMGSKVKVTGSKVKVKVTGFKDNFVCFSAVCLFLYSSQVFGPISIKLGGLMQGWVTESKVKVIFGKVKVKSLGSKVK